ncbi:MAG: hypothetical protein OYM47_00155 [Gemmatimonadota bacterium]|nr:hypothetical protein [Gemmatimonadota bacterium]
MEKTSFDLHDEAAAAVMGNAASGELREIESIRVRLGKLLGDLDGFSFHQVAAPLAGLLTRQENQSATTRIEMLIHLAALVCRGNKKPSPRRLRDWLNTRVFRDPISQLEVPIEDVFVSNVGTWFGNVRLFEGRWHGNSDSVQVCVETLLSLEERPWVMQSLRHAMAMLRLSECIADRAGVVRYSSTTSRPRESINISLSDVDESSDLVIFSDDELVACGVDPVDLCPFVFQGHHAKLLTGQSIGHTALERRPLLRSRGKTTVVLPTAIGAAIRRYVIERALTAGDLRLFHSTYHLAQFSEVFRLGRADWDIEFVRMLESDTDDGLREFVGTFDDDGFVHLLYVPDNFEAIVADGLASIHKLQDVVRGRIHERVALLARKAGCRKGLTVLVHGGIGREFEPVWGDLPDRWHQLCISAFDFMLLGGEPDFTALRAWKLLQSVDELEAEGVVFPNLRGFLNLVAFSYHVNFELVPENMRLGPIYLHSDFILPLRRTIRTVLDRHALISPSGKSWVDVQREALRRQVGEAQRRSVYLSRLHRASREFLACVKSTSRPWWVHCRQLPETGWHHDIVFGILEMVLGWLARLVPAFEERNATLPTGPVAIRIQFPDIETFRQRDCQLKDTPAAPRVAVEDGVISIECVSRYLHSFLSTGNLGDRLMIASLARGVDMLCGNEGVLDAGTEEWVYAVVGSENARFLKMTPSPTLEDAIYDVVSLPQLRLVMPEDRGRSRTDLARRAGFDGEPGSIPSSQACELLNDAVDEVWMRIRSRLVELSRESVVERSLMNYVAARKEHRDWMRSMAAQLSLYDYSAVMAYANDRALRRDTAALASRVIAEMALCTSSYGTGSACAGSDLDFLVAEVSTLLECAVQSDALRFGLATRPPTMHLNGSFGFDQSATVATKLLTTEHWQRTFRDAAKDERAGGEGDDDDELADPDFPSAFLAEFGLTLEHYGSFIHLVTLEALESNVAHLRLRKTEVLQRLRQSGATNPNRAFDAFALAPRAEWNEKHPENAEPRDWWPWRYNRRLSIMRRPLVQLSNEIDPTVIIFPSIIGGTLRYVCQAAFGDLPGTLFDSREMNACIGRAADRSGHEFARRVERQLGELGWKTKREVSLTRFGGDKDLGDIDVLAWQPANGLVYAVECKSLRLDRTCGEIAGRLAEYSSGTFDGKRSLLQRHLDRVSYLESNRSRLAAVVGIPADALTLRSALVTEQLFSMQFAGKAREMLDLVTDYELLESAFSN